MPVPEEQQAAIPGTLPAVVERVDVQAVFDALHARGYTTFGPTIRDGAITYDHVDAVAELPIGWTEQQSGGHYRLVRRDDDALFGYTVGPDSWKRLLHPPVQPLWHAVREGQTVTMEPEQQEPVRWAFLGVRPCETAAIARQDQVFLGGAFVDPTYATRRRELFVVAINCGQAGGTCFCASMGTGPSAQSDYDLALTEVVERDRHYFVIESGTPRGAEVLVDVPHRPATDAEQQAASAITAHTTATMGRTLETGDLKDFLQRNYEHPRWDQVAERCLACGNCTLVCPTCFCTSVEEHTDLSGERAERRRVWDSCFTTAFSYIHGGSVRQSVKSRYRQWMTHKLSTWEDQFGASGCVGCGRCITWCPVGIDITEEVRAMRASNRQSLPTREVNDAAR